MRRGLALLLLSAAAAQAGAERPLTPAEFEAFTAGRTLLFSRGGGDYGAEQYLADRQVIWRFADGTCATGHWFGEGRHICFVYDNAPVPTCWSFVERDGAHIARMAGLEPGDPSEIRLSGELDEPLNCPHPNLGV